MAFDIDAFQKNLLSKLEPVWKPGRWETTSPHPEEKRLEIEYRITGPTTGYFRHKKDPNNISPGKLFQMDGAAIFGWQRSLQKLHLENGNVVHVNGEFIQDNGAFETSGETLE